MSSCTVNADVDKSEFNSVDLYYSFKVCDDSNKCEISFIFTRLSTKYSGYIKAYYAY